MDNLLFLAHNLVELDYKILALNHIFSTLHDKHREFHVLDQVDQPKSKQTESLFFFYDRNIAKMNR